ncbi:MAG: response regulator [Acidobacteriia bacterium]|nr:response regulator [Terriglobia bacterium]
MQLKDATVLVVDDELHYREIMTGWIEKEGSRTLAADNGVRALELLEKNEVHAIVTDIRMPVMDGTELIKRVKARGKYTPAAVAISGFSDLAPRDAYDLGIEAQLSKPVERKALISALRRTLMDREELWAETFRTTSLPGITLEFESLAEALRQKRIAFGRGGFCMASKVPFPEESSISFELNFIGDGQIVSGQGMVRWCAARDQLTGIEITRVSDSARAWVAGLARSNQTVSFIPRST